ncbi:helix-turn-helix transcriptional regulator [Thalassospira sp. NFXS8]
MQTRKLYRDPALTLDRLSRRAIIPARDISLAINRFYGRNISCIINEYRIAEATQLLADTDKTVTDIQFDCGFQTKSNFNREFRRVTGMSPRDYRNRNANQPGTFMTPFNAVPETQEFVG